MISDFLCVFREDMNSNMVVNCPKMRYSAKYCHCLHLPCWRVNTYTLPNNVLFPKLYLLTVLFIWFAIGQLLGSLVRRMDYILTSP